MLRKAFADEFIAGWLLAALGGNSKIGDDGSMFVPSQWKVACMSSGVGHYDSELPLGPPLGRKLALGDWLVLCNGAYFTDIDPLASVRSLNGQAGDVLAVNVSPRLKSGNELVRIASNGEVAGFRRFYDDAVMRGEFPDQWPHYLLIRACCLERLAPNGTIPADFGVFASRCRSNDLVLKSAQIGGNLLDLATEQGLLRLLTQAINGERRPVRDYPEAEPPNVRIIGDVVRGKDVVISEGALVVGPSLIGNRARIGNLAVVRASVVGENVSIPANSFTEHRILFENDGANRQAIRANGSEQSAAMTIGGSERKANFRTWPAFSYAACGKRIADITASIFILALLAPLFPIIAAVIKLTSPGPVFFRHKREGLHGKEFDCIKFRTMIVGSDKIQQLLRRRNQVDGPQFKMAKDPRITAVGRFLRDTFIDEIPQFINILRGDMSVVGPRPSPRAENVTGAPWRDCRLSVRPGVTGLWQISRTRRPGHDFQEWIHYDTMYVRHLSLGTDLSIVFRTITKLARDFINQF